VPAAWKKGGALEQSRCHIRGMREDTWRMEEGEEDQEEEEEEEEEDEDEDEDEEDEEDEAEEEVL